MCQCRVSLLRRICMKRCDGLLSAPRTATTTSLIAAETKWILLHLNQTRLCVRYSQSSVWASGIMQIEQNHEMLWHVFLFVSCVSCSSVIAGDFESAGEWGREGNIYFKGSINSYYRTSVIIVQGKSKYEALQSLNPAALHYKHWLYIPHTMVLPSWLWKKTMWRRVECCGRGMSNSQRSGRQKLWKKKMSEKSSVVCDWLDTECTMGVHLRVSLN